MYKVLISHRGNLNGPTPEFENKQQFIQNAIDFGYDVEIDVRRVNNKLYLGHDTPDYEVSLLWLLERKNNLWIHAKNFEALSYLLEYDLYDLKIFYHQLEAHTIISGCGLIWSHNLNEANEKSIIPLLSMEDIKNYKKTNVYGICSDYVSSLKINTFKDGKK